MITGNIHHLELLPYLPAQLKEAIEFISEYSNQPITAYGYLYAKLLVGVRPLTLQQIIFYSRNTKDPWENENDSKTNS